MTPLAHRIVKSLTLPVKDRCKTDFGDLMHKMDDVHCFDVTEVMPLIIDLARTIVTDGTDVGTYCFLPAPKTWIEFAIDNLKYGYLLEDGDFDHCEYWFAADWYDENNTVEKHQKGNFSSSDMRGRFRLGQTSELADLVFPDGSTDISGSQMVLVLYAALALINTPRLIGRRQHMPHRGLERRLLKQQKLLGHFPLHAWTEIKLEVTPPEEASGSPPTEAHLTGRKALHFCRAHLRVRNGRVEIVRGHWRGDASLGIKRSRYRLTGASA